MLLFLFRVSGHSMEPTLKEGQILFASLLPYLFFKPKVGDVVVFKDEGKVFIKRIKKLEREKYFLTGDNKSDSLDSRKIGWIDRENILGKVLL